MAEPGDPKDPAAPQDDHDAHVGFVSPQSLAGRPRAFEPAPEPVVEDEPDLFDPPEPRPFDSSAATTPVARFDTTPPRAAAPHAALRESLAQREPASRPVRRSRRRHSAPRI